MQHISAGCFQPAPQRCPSILKPPAPQSAWDAHFPWWAPKCWSGFFFLAALGLQIETMDVLRVPRTTGMWEANGFFKTNLFQTHVTVLNRPQCSVCTALTIVVTTLFQWPGLPLKYGNPWSSDPKNWENQYLRIPTIHNYPE